MTSTRELKPVEARGGECGINIQSRAITGIADLISIYSPLQSTYVKRHRTLPMKVYRSIAIDLLPIPVLERHENSPECEREYPKMFLVNWTMRVKGCTSWMKRSELYCSRRVRI
ncbi:hypothetical protein TNCV_3962211 [Trichonephila clavipes]|nr:hypothetical protein TNCV_3962211 [Trichonephila clavipes]